MDQVFEQFIDYAGLFPPASCSMAEAVRNYAQYRSGPDRPMLGRFVVAASRLAEMDATIAAEKISTTPDDPWPLSVVFGVRTAEELQRVADFQAEGTAALVVEAVETRVQSPGHVTVLTEQLPPRWDRFLEIDWGRPYDPVLEAIGHAGMAAKIRMGGTTPDLFPRVRNVTRFLMAAVRAGVPFKATAGLHHAVRGNYPLTYQADSEYHRMFGFVNLLLATALLRRGEDGTVVERLIKEERYRAFVWEADALTWHGHRVPVSELAAARTAFRNFGSCSFREPIDELTEYRG